jgi:PA domain
MNKRLVATALSMAMAACGTAQAADLQLLNADPAGVGLNSTAYAAPVGGNTATTVGGQRVRVYQYALALWGNVLGTNAPVLVQASFAALTCTPTQGVLGSAGPAWSASDSSRRYHGALLNALLETDFAPGIPEIVSQFNSELGTPGCLTTSGWYYGLDGKTPPGKINFLNVVMHEIGHGLGVSGYINKTTGSLNGAPDFYTALAYDNITGKSFIDPTMTNALRATAMRTVGATVWTGSNVNQQAALFLDDGYQETTLTVTAPALLARNYGFYTASFGPLANAANFNGQWVAGLDAADASGPLTSDGCTALTNGAAVTGKIALIERGTCGFTVKVKNAQNAGAIGVVIVNSMPAPPAAADSNWGPMGGVDATITIPSVQVRRADGLAFIANAPITGGMVDGPVTLAGMDVNGRTRLYSPWLVATGSTFSHFDTAASPNLLMEPFDTPQVQAQISLDLTPALLRDMGWPMNDGTTRLPGPLGTTCDTGVDASSDGGITIGGNIAATNSVCLIGATRTSYNTCMANYTNKLYTDGLITSLQRGKILTCVRQYADRMR